MGYNLVADGSGGFGFDFAVGGASPKDLSLGNDADQLQRASAMRAVAAGLERATQRSQAKAASTMSTTSCRHRRQAPCGALRAFGLCRNEAGTDRRKHVRRWSLNPTSLEDVARHLGVSPEEMAQYEEKDASRGSLKKVEAIIGTPVIADAFAVARSPWPSCAQMPRTPIGAMNSGEGSLRPKRSTLRSRIEQSAMIRGTRPHFSNAVVLVLGVLVAAAALDIGQNALWASLPAAFLLQELEVDRELRLHTAEPHEIDLVLIIAVCGHGPPLREASAPVLRSTCRNGRWFEPDQRQLGPLTGEREDEPLNGPSRIAPP